MNRQWTFMAETPWLWLLPMACLITFAIFAGMELKNGKGNKRWVRVGLLLLAHAALLLAGLCPAYRQSLPTTNAILVQAHVSPQLVDSLRELHPEAAVYSLRHESAAADKAIPHAAYLQQDIAPGSTVFLLGRGLEKEELKYLQDYSLRFILEKLPSGLRSLSYNHSLPLGDTLKISTFGTFEQDSLLLRLSLGGIGVDSSRVTKAGAEQVMLQAQPPLAAMLEYNLQLLSSRYDTLEQYLLPVKVRPNQQVKLALLTGHPDFETRFLKNWLAAEGHSVYFQAEMAPGRFIREWLNMERFKPANLNRELLQYVDIVIMDQAYWNGLSPARILELQEAVQQQGLGCLLLGESGLWRPSRNGWSGLPDLRLSARNETLNFNAGEQGEEALLSSYIAVQGGDWLPSLAGGMDEPLMVFRPQQLGRVGVSLVENTYQLLLNDQEGVYKRVWTHILNTLVKAGAQPVAIETDFPVLAGRRMQLRFWQAGDEMQEVVLTEPNQQQQLLPLVQDRHIPGLWYAYAWPRYNGVHSIKIQGGDSLLFVVYPATALPAMQGFKKSRDTYAYIKNISDLDKQADASVEGAYANSMPGTVKTVSPLLFYLLFLLSMAALWIGRKLSGG